MIGIYILERKEGKIQKSYMLAEPSFSPMLEVSEEFNPGSFKSEWLHYHADNI